MKERLDGWAEFHVVRLVFSNSKLAGNLQNNIPFGRNFNDLKLN